MPRNFSVWPWTGSLCANHPFKFLRPPSGSPRLHQDATTISREVFPKQHWYAHHAFKYKKKNNGKIWKNNFLWTGPACACWVLVYLFSLVPHYFIPPHTLALFTRWLLRLLNFFFPIWKACHCQLTQAIQESLRCLSTFLKLWLCKIDRKVSNAVVPSYSHKPIFFFYYYNVVIGYFIYQWLHGGGGANTDQQPLCTAGMVLAHMSMEHLEHDSNHKAPSLLPHGLPCITST